MNKIWFWLIVSSICVLLYINPEIVLPSMLQASENTLKLCLKLCAIYSVWMGILQVMEDSGINKKLSRLLSPMTRKIFGPLDDKTNELVCMNISCNILGMGGAATPLGMKAMSRLDDGSGKANRAMIMLIIFASTSMQILPTTVIGLRITAGSTSPSDIMLATIISAIFTTGIGIAIALLIEKLKKRRNK
jgi:spore maturation protein A